MGHRDELNLVVQFETVAIYPQQGLSNPCHRSSPLRCRELDTFEGTPHETGRRLSASIYTVLSLPPPPAPPAPPSCTKLQEVSPNATQNADWEAGIGNPSARKDNPKSSISHTKHAPRYP